MNKNDDGGGRWGWGGSTILKIRSNFTFKQAVSFIYKDAI